MKPNLKPSTNQLILAAAAALTALANLLEAVHTLLA